METKIKELIEKAASSDLVAFKAGFNDILSDKLREYLELIKQSMHEEIFNAPKKD